jgi:CRP/FNR family cyclic AMP-dependent transcriptional regulator
MDTKLLHKVPLFDSLSESESRAIASRIEVRHWPQGSIIINEGEESNCLYIILSGKVKVFLVDESGQEIILNYLSKGDYFGEVSLFDDGQRSASVITLSDSKFAVLEKDEFVGLMSSHPELTMTILKGTTRRLRDLSNNVRSLAANW